MKTGRFTDIKTAPLEIQAGSEDFSKKLLESLKISDGDNGFKCSSGKLGDGSYDIGFYESTNHWAIRFSSELERDVFFSCARSDQSIKKADHKEIVHMAKNSQLSFECSDLFSLYYYIISYENNLLDPSLDSGDYSKALAEFGNKNKDFLGQNSLLQKKLLEVLGKLGGSFDNDNYFSNSKILTKNNIDLIFNKFTHAPIGLKLNSEISPPEAVSKIFDILINKLPYIGTGINSSYNASSAFINTMIKPSKDDGDYGVFIGGDNEVVINFASLEDRSLFVEMFMNGYNSDGKIWSECGNNKTKLYFNIPISAQDSSPKATLGIDNTSLQVNSLFEEKDLVDIIGSDTAALSDL